MTLLNKPVRETVRRSVLITLIIAMAPIVAPSYRFYPDETTEALQVVSAMRTYKVQASEQEKP